METRFWYLVGAGAGGILGAVVGATVGMWETIITLPIACIALWFILPHLED